MYNGLVVFETQVLLGVGGQRHLKLADKKVSFYTVVKIKW